ncbi:hypothetical protein AX769_14290 [Frondihabitans sp. PAMC 28766]|nr:hypothetical protein AX769_14290 [Frondihabitans sp. PAMC 28766]
MWVGVGGVAAGILVVSEVLTWRASRDGVARDGASAARVEGPTTVLVPGYPSRADGRPGLVQKWRCRIAVRSVDRRPARFVFSGAATHGAARSEAAVMADFAVRHLGVSAQNVVLDERATNTWQNVLFSRPLFAAAGPIIVASNTFHARRTRRYLAKQDPSLAPRLTRGRDWLPGEFILLKPLLVAYEWGRTLESARSTSDASARRWPQPTA